MGDSKERIIVEYEVLNEKRRTSSFKWKDIKDFKFEDGDEITASYEDDYYDDGCHYDSYHWIRVVRFREENDSEYELRQKRIQESRKELKEQRYKNYLRLKKEFENGQDNIGVTGGV